MHLKNRSKVLFVWSENCIFKEDIQKKCVCSYIEPFYWRKNAFELMFFTFHWKFIWGKMTFWMLMALTEDYYYSLTSHIKWGVQSSSNTKRSKEIRSYKDKIRPLCLASVLFQFSYYHLIVMTYVNWSKSL